MRTITEIEHDMEHGRGHKHMLSGGELKHLIEIAKDAATHICDPYGETSCTPLKETIEEARRAGLFGEDKP